MKKRKTLPEESSLRQKAEAIVEKLNSGKANPQVAQISQLSPEAEMRKLIHELQVYQIELEMQNEELQQAVEKAAIAIALYDFAPTGYFTVKPDSTISQLNLCGAKMLGKERLYLRNSRLNQFITPHTQPLFNEFLQICFETGLKQTCEIGLAIQGKPLSFLYLEGMVSEDKNKCLVVAVDITERKQVEEALNANYSLLRIAGETAKFGGWSLNLANNKVTWSDEVAIIHEMPLGYSPSLGEGINFYAPKWRDKITKFVEDCAKSGIPFADEMELITAKGNRIWVRVAGEAVRAQSGRIARIQGAFQDITERKQTENDLKKSNSLLTATLESTADGILVVDKMGKVVSFNNKFIELWQIPESILSTRDDKKLISYILGQLKDPEGFLKKVDELYLNDEEVSFDSIEFKDGRTYERYSQAQLFEGESIGRVWSFRNVTERRQAEAALKTSEEIFNQFLENSPIYIFFKDENIRSLRLSRNFEKMLGRPLDELIGKSMYDLFPSDLAMGMVETDIQILQRGEVVSVEEEFNGRVYSTIKFPIRIKGKADFLAGFTIDITEQKLAEQALKDREASLRELNATKDKFFSIIAHDLRSPFNSIIGFSSLLTKQIQDGDFAAIEKYAGIIQNSSQQAFDLLMNLLEWSRLQTGRMAFNPENIDIVTLIKQSSELLNSSAQEKSITIYTEMPVNLPFFADKAMISTILRNLISNAIKFTETGGQIVISTKQMSNELVISVLDNGVGINSESIGKLFRIDESYSTVGTQNEKGTGLGLLLCKEFIDKHGGRIWVESERGKGSRFFFSIPKGVAAIPSL